LRQRLLQIATLNNRFHGRPSGRPAFDIASRRAGFSLSGGGASGFTRCAAARARLLLCLLLHGLCEIVALLASSTVQAFAGSPRLLCRLLTSSLRSVRLATPRSPVAGTTTQTSRGKTDRLRRTPAGSTIPVLDGRGLRDHLLARPTG
jgi:hypothetical protein